VFYGIRPTVAAQIGYAVRELLKIALVSTVNGSLHINVTSVVICIGTFLLLQVKKLGKLHPILWILAGAVIGIVLKM
ncbi:chromate transporter, partial [Clostridium sp. SL.3.18]|nr:chromate transporter [Clostridium sp. SL.3.18]